MSAVLDELRVQIASRLLLIEDCLPEGYCLTLLARHTSKPDSDILVSAEGDLAVVIQAVEALRKMDPISQGAT